MDYTLIFKERSYDLPKYTKSLKNEIKKVSDDNASPSLTDDEKYKRMYLFIKKVIGEENAMEIFESDNLEEIDINEISICFIKICQGYDKPLNDANRQTTSTISDADRELVLELLKNAGNIPQLEKMIKQNNTAARAPFKAL